MVGYLKMKNLFDVNKPTVRKPSQPKVTFSYNKNKPQPIESYDHYAGICRIMPSYFAKNHEYFELITPPKQKIKDKDGYIVRLKQKITCMKSDFSI